jgi:glucose/arabinose dehydrogenase
MFHRIGQRNAWGILLVTSLSFLPARLSALPTGFEKKTVATGLDVSFLTTAPDGRVFVNEKGGRIRVIENDVLLPTPFADLKSSTKSANERGLLGIALDPNFTANHYVYVYKSDNDDHAYVLRFTANGNVAAGEPTKIFDLQKHAGTYHHGGDVSFGPDGKIYVTLGNGAGALGDVNKVSKDNTDIFGSILRINPDGTVPSDNPFYAQNQGDNRAVWTYGDRNLFNVRFNPVTGKCFFDDVMDGGPDDELNECKSGGGYGYGGGGNIAPLMTSGAGGAMIGGAWYDGAGHLQFPAEYKGKWFQGHANNGNIRVYDPATDKATVFDNLGGDCPVSLALGPQGSLYASTRCGTASNVTNGKVYKISYPSGVTSALPQADINPAGVMRWSSAPGFLSVHLLLEGAQTLELRELSGRLAARASADKGEVRLPTQGLKGVHLLIWQDGADKSRRTMARVVLN